MAEFTLIANAETGEILGGAHGHVGHPPGTNGRSAGLYAGPGQRLEHIQIPDELAQVKDAGEFHVQLKAHLER
jgi:hypothetical protein